MGLSLRGLAETEAEKKVLDDAFPVSVAHWFADVRKEGEDERVLYLKQPRDLSGLAKLVAQHHAVLVATLEDVFLRDWPPKRAASRTTRATVEAAAGT